MEATMLVVVVATTTAILTIFYPYKAHELNPKTKIFTSCKVLHTQFKYMYIMYVIIIIIIDIGSAWATPT